MAMSSALRPTLGQNLRCLDRGLPPNQVARFEQKDNHRGGTRQANFTVFAILAGGRQNPSPARSKKKTKPAKPSNKQYIWNVFRKKKKL